MVPRSTAKKVLRMQATDLVRRLHQHRMWVNERLLEAVGPLTSEQLDQQFAIGQGSLWKSLLHLYAAEFVWLEALLGDEDPLTPGDLPGRLPGNQAGQGGIASLEDLKHKWADLNGRWESYLAGLTPEALDEVVYKKSTSSGLGKRIRDKTRGRAPPRLHARPIHDGAELNMLRQLGIEKLPDPMLITMARQENGSVRNAVGTAGVSSKEEAPKGSNSLHRPFDDIHLQYRVQRSGHWIRNLGATSDRHGPI